MNGVMNQHSAQLRNKHYTKLIEQVPASSKLDFYVSIFSGNNNSGS